MYISNLPEQIEKLNPFVHNLWWSWNQESYELFEKINPEIWNNTRNPLKTITSLSSEGLNHLAKDAEFCSQLASLVEKQNSYLESQNTWYKKNLPQGKNDLVAYFSAEYGIHESLPIYSGGLGILSGDHVKSGSDLGYPMAFVGLFYQNGYFLQQINEEGKQVDVYEDHRPELLPILKATNEKGEQIRFTLDFPERSVTVKVWQANVGRVNIYLLDTNDEANSPQDREITARLYGGDREMRISQEIVLGIGGVRALAELKLEPTTFHMNEGHSGFFQIERINQLMKKENISFEEAKIRCSANCVFTTHTPVPAGNEAFALPLMHKYFHERVKSLNISWHRFLELGMVDEKTDYKYFSLTAFALNVSRFYNGVSELHGRIAKKMWRGHWQNIPEAVNPITHITNGVHVQTWMDKEMKEIVSKHIGHNWEDSLADLKAWEEIRSLPYNEIVKTQENQKSRMITLVRRLLKEQLIRHGKSSEEIKEAESALSTNTLTVGFARRFATYKRATLIFKDLKKLEKLVHHPERPVQFIFAGKAHPADIPGQNFIKEIYEVSRRPEFRGKIIILENYDMNISSHMVAGVDVWLNNPRRPMEASGTSGQKVPLNFGLNFSVLDGWWREGFNGENGWKIGEEKDYPSDEVQDTEDANDFYNTLEQTILPLYYQKGGDGLSPEWIEKCKESFISNIALFSTHRMVQDYIQQLYIPAKNYGNSFIGNSKVNDYLNKRDFFRKNWSDIAVNSFSLGEQVHETGSNYQEYAKTPSHHVEFPLDETIPGRVFEGAKIDAHVNLYLGDISPEEINIDLVTTQNEKIVSTPLKLENKNLDGTVNAYAKASSSDGSTKRWRIRMYPKFEGLNHPFEFALCTWL
jgi:starch phosphorylase